MLKSYTLQGFLIVSPVNPCLINIFGQTRRTEYPCISIFFFYFFLFFNTKGKTEKL